MFDCERQGHGIRAAAGVGLGLGARATLAPAMILAALVVSVGAAPLFDASFEAYETPPVPVDIGLGDLDADGRLDLITADFYDNTIVVRRGFGDGTFGPFRTYADHRMAHAGVILGLGVEGVLVEDIATTSKTFPDFAGAWTALFT